MPSISQPQWDAIGRKAAAVAREVTNRILREELGKLTSPVVNLHIDLQNGEVVTAQLSEEDVWKSHGFTEPKRQVYEEPCRASFTQACDPGFAESFASKPPPRPKPIDGDWFLVSGERFTWWLGQWRRDSELEGFASWLKRKGFTAK